MRWMGQVACIGEMRYVYKILVGKPEGKRPHGRSVHGKMIVIEWIFRKYGGKVWSRFICLRIGTGGRLL
jgi:hypothetical protein